MLHDIGYYINDVGAETTLQVSDAAQQHTSGTSKPARCSGSQLVPGACTCSSCCSLVHMIRAAHAI